MKTKLLHKRKVGPSHYILTLEKNDLLFQSGQYIHLGTQTSLSNREYSIYSSQNEKELEVLLSLQTGGEVSPLLCHSEPGDILNIEGPFGSFILSEEDRQRPLIMIATGTGVSPFHSLIHTYGNLNYQILHGIKTHEERLEWEKFDPDKYTSCTSRSDQGQYKGRVTSYLETIPFATDAVFMLCGNSDMIYDSYKILQKRGVVRENIKAEIYF